MTEKQPLTRRAKPERELAKVRSTCNFCGVGCQVELNVDRAGNGGRGEVIKVTSPPPGTTTNDGNLCVKGRFAYDFIDHPDRLTTPLVRGADGELHPATWPEALAAAAEGLLKVKADHGADALGFVSSSRCTMEENYLVQKLSRAVFGTNNVHQCAAT
jgi:predicted molibdopterin-dependent oxidoreductase YjgC